MRTARGVEHRPAGAVTELSSSRLDDNFTIPVAVAAAVTIAGAG